MDLFGNSDSPDMGASIIRDQSLEQKSSAKANIRITDLRCALIGDSHLKSFQNQPNVISKNSLYALMGDSLIVRITTDAGISGYGQVETTKPYLKPFILFSKTTWLEKILLT